MTDAKKTPFQWGFKSAAATIAVIALWAELFVWLLAATRVADGPAAFAYGAGFFLCILPLIAAAIYAWPLVFGFFRSVKVGITNLIFIGLASIAGVLFIQEDPNGPIAPESAAGDLVEVSPARLATSSARPTRTSPTNYSTAPPAGSTTPSRGPPPSAW